MRRNLIFSGKKPNKPQVIPHDLTPAQQKKRVGICQTLLDRSRSTQWVMLIIIQDEKWISYDNPDRSLQWVDADKKPEPVAKRGTHCMKEMLSFFVSPLGPIYWEILADG